MDPTFNYYDENVAYRVEFNLTVQYDCKIELLLSKYNGYIATIYFIDKIMNFVKSITMSIEELYFLRKEIEGAISENRSMIYELGPNSNYAKGYFILETNCMIKIEKTDIFNRLVEPEFVVKLNDEQLYYFKEQLYWMLVEFFPEDDGNLE